MVSAARTVWHRIVQTVELNWMLLASGITLELGFVIFLQVTDTKNWTWLPSLFLVLFAVYLFIVWQVRKRICSTSLGILIILILAVAFRLTLLFSGPVFSFDIYRYVWDGRVAANGINPYLYAPQAPQLSSLRDANWGQINHKYLRTGYPPLMEALFELLYVAFNTVISFKVAFSIFDIGTIIVVLLLLKELKLDTKNIIIYAWAPLPVVEIAQSGHNDSVAVFFVFLAFLLMARGRNVSSAAVMSLAVISKIYPIFFAPILLKRWGKQGTILFFAITLLSHIPYLGGVGLGIYQSLLFAVNTSNFNGSIFPLITNIISLTKITDNPGLIAQFIVYGIYVSLLAWAFVTAQRGHRDTKWLMEVSFLLTGVLLLLDRSFFSWYVTWLVPFLPFNVFPSWLLLSGTSFLGYFKYGSFPPPEFEAVSMQGALIIDLVEYLPFYALLAFELAKRWRGKFPKLGRVQL
jgi:alpha-1,6-mannosyltransferase